MKTPASPPDFLHPIKSSPNPLPRGPFETVSPPTVAAFAACRRGNRWANYGLLMVCAVMAVGRAFGSYPSPIYHSYYFFGSQRYNHTATVLPSGDVLVAGGRVNESTARDSSIELGQYYDPFEGALFGPATMQTARFAHTAVLLPTGRVLVSGGRNAGGAQFSQETYDATAKEWNAVASMLGARAWHTASLLRNGRVLLVGGDNGAALAATEVYDPSTGTVSAAASLAQARYAHTATTMRDGKLLVVGGRTSVAALASAEVFDSDAGTWTTTAPMSLARFRHETVRLRDGRVLVVGGYGATGQALASCELYDPATGQWSPTGSLHEARAACASVAFGEWERICRWGRDQRRVTAESIGGVSGGEWIVASS